MKSMARGAGFSWVPHAAGKVRLRTLLGMLAVARAVAAGAAGGADQGFLLWLWALLGSDAGHALTQLDDHAAKEEAHVVCMTQVRFNQVAVAR